MSEAKDHTVELWTRQGDRLTQKVTAEEAARYDALPFDDKSNVSMTKVTKNPES